jgi:hypothetical protein
MKNATKNSTIISDMPSVNEAPAPVTEANDFIKPDHIGIVLVGGNGHIGQVHKSMRKFFDNDKWKILEAPEKKTSFTQINKGNQVPVKTVTNP